jgi:hypothetical protein
MKTICFRAACYSGLQMLCLLDSDVGRSLYGSDMVSICTEGASSHRLVKAGSSEGTALR